jgi:hypothetical protein
MMGTGGSYSETAAFDNFLKTNTGGTGFESIRGFTSGQYMFDLWGYFRKPPSSSGGIQTLFYLHHDTNGALVNRVLRFCVENVAGSPVLALYYANSLKTTFTKIYSSEAGAAIFPGGLSQDGGLHQVGFVFDRTVTTAGDIDMSTAPYGFYVDGKYYPSTSGNTSSWATASLSINTNAFIGCEVDSVDGNFSAPKATGTPRFINHFTGKLYQAQLCSSTGITEDRMRMIHGLKFNIPRGPAPVDFSERYEYNGKNLLQEIGNIDQVIGNDKGGFYININQVKVRN